MAVINLAFSGGVESTALLVKALQDGHRVNPCVINVTGQLGIMFAELVTLKKMQAWFKDDAQKGQYAGRIGEIYVHPGNPFAAASHYDFSHTRNGFMADCTQSMAVALGMMKIKRSNIDDHPGTWIGWIREDTAEHSLDERDFLTEDYQALLKLPRQFGRVSGADFLGREFRAPVWDWSKEELHHFIPAGLRDLIIPNFVSASHYDDSEGYIGCRVSEVKREEWVNAGIPCGEKYQFRLDEADIAIRTVTGMLGPHEVDLPETYRGILGEVSSRTLMTLPPFMLSKHYIAKTSFMSTMEQIVKVATPLPEPVQPE